jgi:hypothetical protein
MQHSILLILYADPMPRESWSPRLVTTQTNIPLKEIQGVLHVENNSFDSSHSIIKVWCFCV